jgi:Fe2+ or Zn2+ uptake regulation protein
MSQRATRLRGAGLKATGPRLVILAALEQDHTHPTAEQLYATLRRVHPSLSRSTVSHTLEVFLRTRLCRRVSAPGARLRVDGTPPDHDHAVCRLCGAIFDVERDQLPLPRLPEHVSHGLLVTGIRLAYEVICAPCQEAPDRAGERHGAEAVSGSRADGQGPSASCGHGLVRSM